MESRHTNQTKPQVTNHKQRAIIKACARAVDYWIDYTPSLHDPRNYNNNSMEMTMLYIDGLITPDQAHIIVDALDNLLDVIKSID